MEYLVQKDPSLSSLVATNRNTGLIHLIACLSMLIDHAGKMFFPRLIIMRCIGRLAFPLFAYCLAVGAIYTKNDLRYLSRIVLLALISQPLYALGLAHENAAMFSVPFFRNPLYSAVTFYLNSWQKPSILFSFSLALCVLLCFKRNQWVLCAALLIFCNLISTKLDYGFYGILVVLIFFLFCYHPMHCLLVSCAFWLWWSTQNPQYVFMGFAYNMRLYALPALLFVCLPLRRRLVLPRWLNYGFYPAHLAVLAVLCRVKQPVSLNFDLIFNFFSKMS